jgi:hypothetical protein
MNFESEQHRAAAMLVAFGASAAQRASDRADSEAINLRDERAASWRRVTALILASPQSAFQLLAA